MKSGMGTFRYTKTIFLLFVLLGTLLISISICVSSGGVSVWPAKLIIRMGGEFPEKEIEYKIYVQNLNQYAINASARIENPPAYYLNKTYTFIPDLSWVKIKQNVSYLSARQTTFFDVLIDIPDNEKSLHYNERWEVLVVVSGIRYGSPPTNTTFINTEIGIKIIIITPERENMQTPYNSTFMLVSVVAIFTIFVAFVFFTKKKKRTSPEKKPAVFYFEKRKFKN
jgi:hypothetical protein